jgi:outer membrane murein-binding lipoprotein Lpp
MRMVAAGACAAVLAALVLAGCASSSSTNPLLKHSQHGTLSCTSMMVSGNTLAYDAQTLASDNQAISGQWTAAEAAIAGANSTPTSAQQQAITDLTGAISDIGTGSLGPGNLAATVTALESDGAKLTNGASGWRSAGPKVKADITNLDKACGSSSDVGG